MPTQKEKNDWSAGKRPALQSCVTSVIKQNSSRKKAQKTQKKF